MENVTLETVKNSPNTYFSDSQKNLMVYLPEGFDKFGKEGPGIYVAAHGDGDLLLELAIADSPADHIHTDLSLAEATEHFENFLANHEFEEADPLLVEEFLEKLDKVVSVQTLKENSNLVAIDSSGGALYYDQQDKVFKYLQSGWYVDGFQSLIPTWEHSPIDEDTYISRYLARNGATLAVSWDEVYERFGERPEGGVKSIGDVLGGWADSDVYLTSHKKGSLHFSLPREDGAKGLDFVPVTYLANDRAGSLVLAVKGLHDKLDQPGELAEMFQNLHTICEDKDSLEVFIKSADGEFAPYRWVDKSGYPVEAPTIFELSND